MVGIDILKGGFLVNVKYVAYTRRIVKLQILIKEGFNTFDKTANIVEKNEGSVKFLKKVEEINLKMFLLLMTQVRYILQVILSKR